MNKKLTKAQQEVARLRGEMAVAVQVAGRGLHWSACYGAHFPTSGAVEETADGAAMLASLAKEAEAHNAAMREQGRREGLLEARVGEARIMAGLILSAYDPATPADRAAPTAAAAIERAHRFLLDTKAAALSPEEGRS